MRSQISQTNEDRRAHPTLGGAGPSPDRLFPSVSWPRSARQPLSAGSAPLASPLSLSFSLSCLHCTEAALGPGLSCGPAPAPVLRHNHGAMPGPHLQATWRPRTPDVAISDVDVAASEVDVASSTWKPPRSRPRLASWRWAAVAACGGVTTSWRPRCDGDASARAGSGSTMDGSESLGDNAWGRAAASPALLPCHHPGDLHPLLFALREPECLSSGERSEALWPWLPRSGSPPWSSALRSTRRPSGFIAALQPQL